MIKPSEPCGYCGRGHFTDQCRAWTECAECGRPAHGKRSSLTPAQAAGTSPLFCRDCSDPSWRSHLDIGNLAYRMPGRPVYLPYNDKPSGTLRPTDPWSPPWTHAHPPLPPDEMPTGPIPVIHSG